MIFKRSSLAVGVLAMAIVIAVPGWAKRHRHKADGESGAGSFDYYLLALSWAPNYCASHSGDHSSECRLGNHKAFVLHGLWPQAENGAPPKECAPASPVAHEVVDHMLEYMPSAGLVQHEWREHGTCSGLSSRDYFAQAEQAFKTLQVPAALQSLSHGKSLDVAEIESQFAEANHAGKESFRVSCYNGELVAVEACMDKSLHLRACSHSVRECRTGQVQMEAVR